RYAPQIEAAASLAQIPPRLLAEVVIPQESGGNKQALSSGGWAGTPAHGIMQIVRSEEHTSELQSLTNIVCRLLLEKKKTQSNVQRIVDPARAAIGSNGLIVCATGALTSAAQVRSRSPKRRVRLTNPAAADDAAPAG